MFKLLRYFSITSAAAMVLAIVVLTTFFHNYEKTALIEMAENQNKILARSFSNAIWARFSPYLKSIAGLDGDALRARPETKEIHDVLQKLTAGLPVLKVKIYSLKGIVLFSSEFRQIGDDKSKTPGFLSAGRQGIAASELSFRDTFSAFEGEVIDRDLISSYLPIYGPNGSLEGVFEIYTDVTPLMNRLDQATLRLGVALPILFLVLYFALYLIVRHADIILKRQQLELFEAEKKKNERLASDKLHSFFIYNINDGAFLIENEEIRDVSRVGAYILGYTREELIGQSPDIIVLPEVQEEARRRIKEGNEDIYITKGRRKDGSSFPIEVRGQELEYEGRQLRLTTIRDITERERTKRALHKSEERYSHIINGIHDAIWEWDIYNDTLEMTPRVFEMLGYGEDEIKLGFSEWEVLIHPDDIEKRQSRLKKYLTKETSIYSCEYRVRTKSNGYIWVLARGTALRDDTDHAYRMAGSFSDVTQRRLAEDGLRHSQKMDAVGQLASGIAHEFRNTLVGIGGFTEMALMDVGDAENVQMSLEEVRKATERASKLTNDLLAYSRNQEVRPTNIIFDISDILHDALAFLKPVMNKNIALKMDISEQPVFVNADPSQLSQVVINLAINSRDAMVDGGELTIGSGMLELGHDQMLDHIHARPGMYAQITVNDTGTGIEKDILKRLFDPFFTTKEVGKGTGLGLSVAYGIVEQAGGFISVESILGEGSKFIVNLPIVEEET